MVATAESIRDSTTPWYPDDKSLDGKESLLNNLCFLVLWVAQLVHLVLLEVFASWSPAYGTVA